MTPRHDALTTCGSQMLAQVEDLKALSHRRTIGDFEERHHLAELARCERQEAAWHRQSQQHLAWLQEYDERQENPDHEQQAQMLSAHYPALVRLLDWVRGWFHGAEKAETPACQC